MKQNDILLIHGTNYLEMTKQLLCRADLAGDIGDRRKRIALKPNLVTDTAPAAGATTHGELLSGTIEYLRDQGFRDITIMESSWVGARTGSAMRVCGYDAICKQYDVPFLDLKGDSHREYDAKGMKIKICDAAMAVDYMINMPVLKGHCQTTVTCALKNNKGVIPDSEKRRFHTLGLHKPIAHLNTVCKNDFILVDNICGDLDFEEGGNPVPMNRILCFKDPVLCVAFVCSAMGHDVRAVPYIGMAERLRVGSADLTKANLFELNEPYRARTGPKKLSRRVEKLAGYTAPLDACSACYGSLIHALSRIEEHGFLRSLKEPICIGQGYQRKAGGIGVGRCTAGCDCSLPGCPPRADDIYAFLTEQANR